MVADGFWATKRLLMLLTSVNKTGQAPQDAKGSRAMSKWGTREAVSLTPRQLVQRGKRFSSG